MSKCDDDIIFEAFLNRKGIIKEGFEFFEGESNDKQNITSSETKDFEQPKSKLTEDEAKEYFINSDAFHQCFHKFMEKTGYSEKEIDGKELWCKCESKDKTKDEDEQQPVAQQQPVANNQNTQAIQQEIINALGQMTPDQLNATYQAIFGQ